MPSPICIFRPDQRTFHDAASDLGILFTPEIQNHKIVVISIAGRFRQGKSFLMNFIIRYLRAKGEPGWLEKDAENELGGFDWQHTQDPVTLGVLIWPEIFKMRDASGKEVAVVLMDSQGVFDMNSTVKDSTRVFALSILLSSVQIFNVKQNIQGDDLGHLELFAELGRLVSSSGRQGSTELHSNANEPPFQDLIFLVRDWSYPTQNAFGWGGGEKLLKKVFERRDAQLELASMRANIKENFGSIKSFLMPHPGDKVDTSSEFRGKLSDMKPIFVESIKAFIEEILRPNNLKPKKINGAPLTVREFGVFLADYTMEMHKEDIPTPERLFEATVRAFNRKIVDDCLEKYQATLLEIITEDPREADSFKVVRTYVTENTVNYLWRSGIMGGETARAIALEDLMTRIDSTEEYFEQLNNIAYERKQYEEIWRKTKQAFAAVLPILAALASILFRVRLV